MISNIGKTVAQNVYLHVSALDHAVQEIQECVSEAKKLALCSYQLNFNVVRTDLTNASVSFLSYPNFIEDPFPALAESWLVNLKAGRVTYRTYKNSDNQPILHRKELLLLQDHENFLQFSSLTSAAESIGLFDDPSRIGYRKQWEALIKIKGYSLEGYEFLPIGNAYPPEQPTNEVESHGFARHLTALNRHGYSAPIQTLARYGLLDGRFDFFDYGCGRGDDMHGLAENGIVVGGWDPYYAAKNAIVPADIVNLGFVINVIEDLNERVEALSRAYSLSRHLLVVSVMLTNKNVMDGQQFGDGVVTRRRTFQKYYSQLELKVFLEKVLCEEPIAISPGIFYVFRDKDTEQKFLSARFRSRRTVLSPVPRTVRDVPVRIRVDRAEKKYQEYREVLDSLWGRWVALGRTPEKTEVDNIISLLDGFGTLSKALRFIQQRNDYGQVEAAKLSRTQDMRVYFALQAFGRRKPYKHLEASFKSDIKAFFGDYRAALDAGSELLLNVASPGAVNHACRIAAEMGLGYYEDSGSLQLHVGMVEQLPPILRVYIGCASILYGDYRSADLVKIHIRSGKLSLMRFDDFDGQPIPRMVERVKISLKEQDIDYFLYGEEFEPPFLYKKSRFINEEQKHFSEQLAFDEKLEHIEIIDLAGYGPKPDVFRRALEMNRWEIDGFSLQRSSKIPELDARCGKYFCFRDFIECGETQAVSGDPNLPKQPESYTALYELAVNILDPIVDYYGMIRLTYGFCSTSLATKIKRRVAPKLDQHSAWERKRSGQYICDRLGAAVDFIVVDEDMEEVANWVISHMPFDRLYFYGAGMPIHVSYSDNPAKQAFRMESGSSGHLYPRPFFGNHKTCP